MIVLGIDTSGYANAVGVVDSDRVLADSIFEAKTDSLEQIVANIDDVLKIAGLTLKEVQGIGVGLGPGSWTGIRVGVTVGKMLAFSTGKPVAGVPTLEALAFGARDESSLILAVVSAGTGDTVYAASYRASDGIVARVGDYYVGAVGGLAVMIKEPFVIVGAGAESYRRTLTQEMGPSGISVRAVGAVPNGALVAVLTAQRLERGGGDDMLALTPLYLKESTAKALVNRYSGQARVKD